MPWLHYNHNDLVRRIAEFEQVRTKGFFSIVHHSLYRLLNIVRVIKSRRLEEHVARMQEGRSAFKILTGKETFDRLVGLVVSMSDY